MARNLLLSLLAACTLAACKEPSNEKLMNALDDYEYERDGNRALVCTCPAELDYATSDECEQAQVALGPDQKDCIADAFADHDQLAVDYFECIVPIEQAVRDCLSERLGVCEANWFVPCDVIRNTRVSEECPSLPSEVASAYALCLPG